MTQADEATIAPFNVTHFCDQLLDSQKSLDEKKQLVANQDLHLDALRKELTLTSQPEYKNLTLLQFLVKQNLINSVKQENLDALEFSDIHAKVKKGNHEGKTTLWFVVENAIEGRDDFFNFIKRKFNNDLRMSHFRPYARTGVDKGKTIFWLALKGACHNKSNVYTYIYSNFKRNITFNDMQVKAESGPDTDVTGVRLAFESATSQNPEGMSLPFALITRKFKDKITKEMVLAAPNGGMFNEQSIIHLALKFQRQNTSLLSFIRDNLGAQLSLEDITLNSAPATTISALLHMAASLSVKGNNMMAKFLMENFADQINFSEFRVKHNNNGIIASPWMWAVASARHQESWLLEQILKQYENDITHEDMKAVFVGGNYDGLTVFTYALHMAIWGKLQLFRFFEKNLADRFTLNDFTYLPRCGHSHHLNCAIIAHGRGHPEVFEFITSNYGKELTLEHFRVKETSRSYQGSSCISAAIDNYSSHNRIEIFEYITSRFGNQLNLSDFTSPRVKSNITGRTDLMEAVELAKQGKTAILDYILAQLGNKMYYNNINQVDSQGNSALSLAASSTDVVRKILSKSYTIHASMNLPEVHNLYKAKEIYRNICAPTEQPTPNQVVLAARNAKDEGFELSDKILNTMVNMYFMNSFNEALGYIEGTAAKTVALQRALSFALIIEDDTERDRSIRDVARLYLGGMLHDKDLEKVAPDAIWEVMHKDTPMHLIFHYLDDMKRILNNHKKLKDINQDIQSEQTKLEQAKNTNSHLTNLLGSKLSDDDKVDIEPKPQAITHQFEHERNTPEEDDEVDSGPKAKQSINL